MDDVTRYQLYITFSQKKTFCFDRDFTLWEVLTQYMNGLQVGSLWSEKKHLSLLCILQTACSAEQFC